MRDWCLVTDIDGTLIGDRETTTELRSALMRAREACSSSGHKIRWVVATGRDVASTREVLDDGGFQPSDFDALITSVGAEMYVADGAQPDRDYNERLESSGFDARLVREALADLAELKLQPGHEQFPFKVCYFATDTPRLRELIGLRLATLPFTTTMILAMGRYLDVAPECGAKGGAVAHLSSVWGLDVEQVVAAGDSGNDLTMLGQQWPAIVVGNGHDALASLRGRPRVYFAKAKYAAGVLEGLRELRFL